MICINNFAKHLSEIYLHSFEGESIFEIAYKIYVGTIGFLLDLQRNNMMSRKDEWDFSTVIYTKSCWFGMEEKRRLNNIKNQERLKTVKKSESALSQPPEKSQSI